ncbi:restriction endonuclease subunit S [Calidithermus roseus]|uniref:Type I restriction modification DNA specificity domain protein n=1 Tax=Calidithermus roseus TaxID=1644118 RepID=A0A399EUZ9_9DEIN|nr:restriction endonuclease subunit S [Calidithermus roseus]RIH87453.1 Type I restriction modification DNA specificity domain protein [Calidithermus roseus]
MSSPTIEVPKPETRPKLPEGWRWVRLGELVESAQPGFASGERSPAGVIQVRMNNVTTLGTLNWIEITRVPRPSKGLGKLLLQPGDVLFNNTNSVELVGKSALFQGHEEEVTFSNHFTRLRTLKHLLDPAYLTFWLVSQWQTKTFERICVRWIGQAAVQRNKLLTLELPLPPLETQRRIAAILTEQMGAVEKARKAAEDGLEAARKLAGAYIVASFRGPRVADWDRVPLADISTFLPAKSIASDGDTEVLAITTACLSELGFRPEGIKTARMWANDAREATVSPGEILIARSNTPELVGRVAVYPGGYPNLVASDLTIRIKATGADPAYLGAYLSSLYLSGYWKERAGGASGSMKKITRGQLQAEHIPLPDLETQRRTVAELNSKTEATKQLVRHLEAQLEAIRALPAAILRRAFSGEL